MKINNEWLTIGTTVLLNAGNQPLTIIGRYQMSKDKVTYDYTGILNPQGYQDSKSLYLFNQNDIAEVLFEAPTTEYEHRYLKELSDFINQEIE